MGGRNQHHSESPEAYFAHTPGLRVLCPSGPHDAYDLLGRSHGRPRRARHR
ncbi:hypothetical protein L0C25_04660 [Solicola gregarius]|uniref:Uncharacterized protein n=1 Tax=Solicola gregarius TaxID=2908642 RepID=A0AA46YN48_9ACTN|nr:hypothetical protein [Solicola gregarius]UYM06373.1 hypothetical protein L0C25_04660 [Solicola gregarius]